MKVLGAVTRQRSEAEGGLAFDFFRVPGEGRDPCVEPTLR